VVSTDDPSAAGGKYGAADIVTKKLLKLQAEGHDVQYRRVWIKELDLKEPDTNF
jgi:hypothetical protein